jgi:UPF0755 protein
LSPTSKKNKSKSKFKWIAAAILTAILVIVLALFFWFIVAVNSPKDSKQTNKSLFVVKANMGLDQISNDLYAKGLIADKNIFILYSKFGPSRGNLKPGTYLLSPSMSLSRIADTIGRGAVASEKITFPEGTTIEQMSKKWAKTNLGTANGFVEASNLQNTYKQSFLQYRSNKQSLEGYLFPATYTVVYASTAQSQIDTMLDNFERQVLPKLPAEYQNSSKLNDLITLASIVEREANTSEDRRGVAAVFYNRLRLGMKLESDVTVNYATGKTQTLPSDLSIDSPYNTYKVAGLPIGPICNPGLDSILATLNPDQNDYLFFLADQNGVVRYAKNLDEHNQNIEKYLNQ